MDPQNQTKDSSKKKIIIVSIIIVILLIVAGYFLYQQSKNSLINKESDPHQKEIDEAALSSSQIKMTDIEKAKIVTDLQKQPGVKLAPDQAKKTEANFLNKIIKQ